MRKLIVYVLIFLMWFFIFSYVELELNPLKWSDGGRVVFVVLLLFSLFIRFIYCLETDGIGDHLIGYNPRPDKVILPPKPTPEPPRPPKEKLEYIIPRPIVKLGIICDKCGCDIWELDYLEAKCKNPNDLCDRRLSLDEVRDLQVEAKDLV